MLYRTLTSQLSLSQKKMTYQGTLKRGMVALAAVAVVGCARPPEMCDGDCVFTPGGPSDPVVKMHRQALSESRDSVRVTIENTSRYSWSNGLITTRAIFAEGQLASQALIDFVDRRGKYPGDPQELAKALGLTLGVDAWAVQSIDKPDNGVPTSRTVSIEVPSDAKLSYIARVVGSSDHFVAFSDVPLTGDVGAAITQSMKGYDLNGGPGGTIAAGNSTTGESLPQGSGVAVQNDSDCPGGALSVRSNFLTDDFSEGANDSLWPSNAGYAGDFNGDWYTDGYTARLYNPNWGGAESSAPIPTVSGFVKWLDVCPQAGATLSVETTVTTDFTEAGDTTLVVYFFDRAGSLLDVTTNFPLVGKNSLRFALYDASIPSSTRRIAVVPMVYLSAGEMGTAYYDRIAVDYEPGTQSATRLLAENFTSYGDSAYGGNQPTGWAEFGGDWFVEPSYQFATLWNSTWGGDQTLLPPVDTGLVKMIDLTGQYAEGDLISARMFAATTFTDPSSFVRLRLVFNSPLGPALESDRLSRGYGNLDIRRQTIPAGVTSVHVIINAYLGPGEQSSLYVDDLAVDIVHPQ